jgi:hypothetical protein
MVAPFRPRRIHVAAGLFPLTFLLASCASISVRDDYDAQKLEPTAKPMHVYVLPFDTADGDFRVDRSGDELAAFKKDLQSLMTADLLERIRKHIGPASPASSLAEIPPGRNWVVGGEFVRINQGSRALRTVIGLGAGGTKYETRVRVYNMEPGLPYPFMIFETTGGSNAEPGAVTGIGGGPVMTVIGVAASAAAVVGKGLTEDTARTSRMITAQLSDYLYRAGWIQAEQRLIPKQFNDPNDPTISMSEEVQKRNRSRPDNP